MNVSNSKIEEIAIELRKLNLEDNPHAVAVLFRVFLELSVDVYLTKKGISTTFTANGHTKDKSLKAKVKESIDEMEKSGLRRKNFVGVANAIDDPKSPLFIETLHNYVHNCFVSPLERELRVAWDNAQPFFEAIWT